MRWFKSKEDLEVTEKKRETVHYEGKELGPPPKNKKTKCGWCGNKDWKYTPITKEHTFDAVDGSLAKVKGPALMVYCMHCNIGFPTNTYEGANKVDSEEPEEPEDEPQPQETE